VPSRSRRRCRSRARSDNSLSRGERELITAYVSRLNECVYCACSHGATAAAQLPGGAATVEQTLADAGTAPVSDKMRALLDIARLVQVSGRMVTADAVAKARAEGATDVEIHDVVLIAAVACLLNRYVNGLGTSTYEDPAEYAAGARFLVGHGYRTPRQPPRRAGLRAAIQTPPARSPRWLQVHRAQQPGNQRCR
jgi:uncharacterized peroxidase-related enzyme